MADKNKDTNTDKETEVVDFKKLVTKDQEEEPKKKIKGTATLKVDTQDGLKEVTSFDKPTKDQLEKKVKVEREEKKAKLDERKAKLDNETKDRVAKARETARVKQNTKPKVELKVEAKEEVKEEVAKTDGGTLRVQTPDGIKEITSFDGERRDLTKPRKIIFHNPLSPGDILAMSSAIRDLHIKYPNQFITGVDTPCNAVFENNKYITWGMKKEDPDVEFIRMEYDMIHNSNEGQFHFIHGFYHDMELKLGVELPEVIYRDKEKKHIMSEYRKFKPHIDLSDDEKGWISQVHEITGKDTRFWIVVSGGKFDYTAKWWSPHRMQKVIEAFPEMTFVQVGQKEHYHPELIGNNVINLIGQTSVRQLVRLMYHADGCICPVTFLMHLAAAVPVKDGRPLERACIVIGGGREPQQWETYPQHRYLSTTGCLPCCDRGGCWKSRVEAIGDGDDKDKDDSLCTMPVRTEGDIVIPKCMDMITAQDVIREVQKYNEYHKTYDRSVELGRPKIKTFERTSAKVGRNTRCPCGSEKKYKFCCGKGE